MSNDWPQLRRTSWWLILLLILVTIVQGHSVTETRTARAATTNEHVLLVYDSVATANDGDQKIQALQRTLTTLNCHVKTVALADYQQGDLLQPDRYQSVITLINWAQKTAVQRSRPAYWQDLKKFNGRRLHIGQEVQPFERQAFQGQWQQVTHQQYRLLDDQSQAQQMLAFTNETILLEPTAGVGQTVGKLQNQALRAADYPYGVIQGRQAYLPFYQAAGLPALVATRLLSQWLGSETVAQPPLLTIGNVTPMTAFGPLRQLIKFLEREQLPFAVSATSVQVNTELPEFRRYTKILREIEQAGGVIFLQVPYVYTSQPHQLPVLQQVMTAQLRALVKEAVYPVGISAPTYWNQDAVYQTAGLARSQQVLLLANPQTVSYQDRRASNHVYQRSLAALPLASLTTIQQQGQFDLSQLQFAAPTALTVDAPSTTKQLLHLKKQIKGLTMPLANPALTPQFAGKVTFGQHQISYRQGNYYLDGQLQTLTKQASTLPAKKATVSRTGTLNGFFKFQDQALMIFLLVVLVVLLLLMIVGRRVYLNKFRRPK